MAQDASQRRTYSHKKQHCRRATRINGTGSKNGAVGVAAAAAAAAPRMYITCELRGLGVVEVTANRAAAHRYTILAECRTWRRHFLGNYLIGAATFSF